MITTLLSSRLGNQMFQYAAGKALAEYHRTSLRLYMMMGTPYLLHSFDIPAQVRIDYPLGAPGRFFSKTVQGRARGLHNHLKAAVGAMHLLKLKRSKNIMKEVYILRGGRLPSVESFTRIKRDARLMGYWQNPVYFEAIAADLARDFTVNTPPNEANRNLLEYIRTSTAVAVHVRRTDYANSPYHVLLSADYYRAAFRRIGESLADPVFFVFSDDLDWSRRHVRPPGETHYVDVNGPRHGHEDMRLMRACSHFVIANSSFSWWPAWLTWLANKRDKIVIAPKAWHTARVYQKIDIGRYCPRHWVRV